MSKRRGTYIGGSTVIQTKRDHGWSKRYARWRNRAEREAQNNIKKLAAMPDEYSSAPPASKLVEVASNMNAIPGVRLLRPR